MDAEQIISKYIEIRDFKKREADAFAERMKPYDQALQTLAGAAALLAKQTGQSALKANSGTAFPTTQLRVKNADREKFLDWVFQNNAREFLTAHVSKEAVKQYLEDSDVPPPGIEIETSIEWQFRKA
jgi:hypothetical protein